MALSPVEVVTVFHLPLNQLRPRRPRERRIRGSTSYLTYDVTDLVAPGVEQSHAGPNPKDEVGGGFDGQLDIWRSMGWYLGLFTKIFLVIVATRCGPPGVEATVVVTPCFFRTFDWTLGLRP